MKTRIPAWLLLLTGVAALGLLAATVWAGRPPPLAVLLGKPKGLIVIAALSFFGAHCLALQPWRTRRRALLFIGRWTFLAVSLGVSLLLAESLLRRAMQQRQARGGLWDLVEPHEGAFEFDGDFTPMLAIIRRSANPRLIYELQPNLDMLFGHRRLRTNAAGQRDDRDYQPGRTPGVFRIVGIGDSGMFGWGVEQGEDYMRRLEELLNLGASPRFEVINLAVPGYNTQQEVDMLRERGLRYEPDIVILGWCDNDFDLPFLIEKPWDACEHSRLLLYSLLFYRDETLAPRIMRASELEAAAIDPGILRYAGVEGVRRSLAELRELGHRHHFKLLVFGAMNANIVEICRDLEIPFFNTRERIPADRYPPEYAVYFMHPRAEGHRVLGAYIESELRQRNWLP